MERFRYRRWHGSPALDRQGFTLIEIAVVLVIVGILIGVATALLGPLVKQAKYRQTVETVKAAKEAVIGYVLNSRRLPTAAEFSSITKNVDAWNTNLFYYPDPLLTPGVPDLCCTATTGFQLEDRCPAGESCATAHACCKPETAFVIYSLGENHADETDNSPLVPRFKILQYGTNYDDIVEYVDLSRLRQELSCSSLEIGSSTLPEGTEDVAYNAQAQGSGGCMPYTWSALGPFSGLSLDAAGTISGTVNYSPPPAGTLGACSNTIGIPGVTLTDAQGKTVTEDLSILVYPQTLRITNSDLPSITEGASGALATLNGTGGMNAYTWTLSGAALPGWLTVNGAGLLSANPPAGSAGDYPFTAVLDDTCSSTSKGFSVRVNAGAAGACGALLLTPSSGSSWPVTVGTAFSQSITVSGGQGPYTNTGCAASGTCNGLTLTCDAVGAVISGNPLSAGTCTVDVSWNDSCATPGPQTISGSYDVNISAAACPAFAGWSTDLPAATNCQSYIGSVTVLGGLPNYLWTINPSPILGGLTDCNGQAGASTVCSISGITLAAAGLYPFTASVTDSCASPAPQNISQPFSITVNPDACYAGGMQLRNQSGATRYYQVNGAGACNAWPTGGAARDLTVSPGNTYTVYSNNICTILFCGSTVNYCQQQLFDSNGNCNTRMNNPCAFVDR